MIKMGFRYSGLFNFSDLFRAAALPLPRLMEWFNNDSSRQNLLCCAETFERHDWNNHWAQQVTG